MLFLIDYENVGKAGMKGCDYLNAQDHMIIFYSEARRHMEQRILCRKNQNKRGLT